MQTGKEKNNQMNLVHDAHSFYYFVIMVLMGSDHQIEKKDVSLQAKETIQPKLILKLSIFE